MPSAAEVGQHSACQQSSDTSDRHFGFPNGSLQPGEPDFYDEAEPTGELMDLTWAADLRAAPGVEPVMTAGGLLSPNSAMSDDHLFTHLLRHDLLRDLVCLYERPSRTLHALVAFGGNVCGHGGLVHGGMTATVMDEAFGALAYVLKREGVLGKGPAYTARLEVDYKKPLPAPSQVVCTVRLISVEGRKGWLSAELRDGPGAAATLFAAGKALFIVARQPPKEPADLNDFVAQ